MDLDDLVRINRAWLYKDLKVSYLQANASLAQLVRHLTPKPESFASDRIPLEVTFFAVVKSFDAIIMISANFVLTVKNSNEPNDDYGCHIVCKNLNSFL